MKYLSNKDVFKLKNIKLIAKRVVEGFLYGFHKSPYSGVNIEFSEYRPYSYGDELKNIDWKLWGKTDRLFVKKFEEETNMRVWLMLDNSASMEFKGDSTDVSKMEYSKMLTASLSYLFLNQSDAVGLSVFSDNINNIIPPSLKRDQFSRITQRLETLQAEGKTDMVKTFQDFSFYIKKRGLIIIISDFLEDNTNLYKAITYFKHKKNEVIVFHIVDKEELDFPYDREFVFVNPETGEKIQENSVNIRKNYRKFFKANMDNVKKLCFENSISYYEIKTNMNVIEVLTKIFKK